MLIIIEGVDGSGKSTLAEALVAATSGAELLHRGPLRRDPLTEYLHPLHDYKPRTGRNIVCDRWHLGEDVYGPLLRGESKLGVERGRPRRLIEERLVSAGAIIVLMDPPVKLVKRRLRERGDDLITEDQVGQIVGDYRRLIQTTAVRTVHENAQIVNSSLVARIRLIAQEQELLAYDRSQA